MSAYSRDNDLSIELKVCTLPVLNAIISGPEEIDRQLGLRVSEQWTEFGSKAFEFTRQLLLKGEDPEWWTYIAVADKLSQIVGTCGYKGPPDENGMVEIGYEVARSYRDRGIASEIARRLSEMAFDHIEVSYIQAHTQAERNASVRVLEKNGFDFEEEIEIDGEGMVWRWKKTRP